MSESDILAKAVSLKDVLKNDPIITRVKEQEKALLDNPDVIPLIIRFQNAQNAFNDAIRFSLELSIYQKELSLAKEALYYHPEVVKYHRALDEANSYLTSIGQELFKDVIVGFDKINVKWGYKR